MKKLLSLLMIASLFAMWSCGDDDDNDPEVPEPVDETVSGVLSEDATWTSGSTVTLDGRVIIPDGITLTIESGVVVKGEEGEGTQASVLIVAQGGKLNANGTATDPIIFTSVLDNIEPGQVSGSNLDVTDNSLWGGLIILGKGPISADAETAIIEGLPADEAYAVYGGSDASDNSGVINYISIRHGGITIGEGNEINGLTLGGVGSGTSIQNVEVAGNKDDGIEWFGGSVNVTNALVWGADDDAIDIDQAYSGVIDNAVVIAVEGLTDHALEIDGPEGTLEGSFTLTNVTIKGNDQEPADFRDCPIGLVSNLYIFGYSADPAVDGEGDFSLSNPEDDEGNLESTCTTDNFESGALSFANIEVTLASGVTVDAMFKGNEDLISVVTEVAEGATSVGADTGDFAWTYASAAGALDF